MYQGSSEDLVSKDINKIFNSHKCHGSLGTIPAHDAQHKGKYNRYKYKYSVTD